MGKNRGPLVLSAALIGLYLVVRNPGGVSAVFNGVNTGGPKLVQAFQGR